MKILHCIATYEPAWKYGGTVLWCARVCKALATTGANVTVLTTCAGIEKADFLLDGSPVDRQGVTVHYFPVEPGMGIKSSALEHAACEMAEDFDIAHISGVWQRTSPSVCRACSQAGTPYVLSLHGALGPYSWKRGFLKKTVYYSLWERRNLRGAAGIHFTSHQELDECLSYTFGHPYAVIPNPLPLENWQRDLTWAGYWRARFQIAPSTPILACVGRLHHKKGLELLPETLSLLKDLPWNLVFVGQDDDGTEGRLKNQFEERGLSSRVRFAGLISSEELPAIYSAAQILLVPSLHENFANNVIEALACGCPAILSNHVGAGGEMQNVSEIKVLPRTPAVWAEAIRSTLSQGRMSNERTEKLRELLTARFSSQTTACAMIDFYRDILSHSA